MNKIPKLRFKEFSGEWEEKRLEEIFEISKTKYNPLKETKEYPCIELESLSQETGKILKTFNSLEQKSIKNKFLKNEVLFGKLRPYLKKYWYSNFEGVCSSEIWVLNSKNNINKFIYYFIQGENFISLANTTSGTKMPRADWSLMKNEIFSIPNIQEQEKIADFLSSVDKKISITEEKLDLFKDYKKGIIQKIFNQELRFKDSKGNNYPEWELVTTKEVSKITMGFTPSTKDESMWNGKYKWLSIADLKENGKYIHKTSKTITDKGIKNKKILKKGTLIMSFKLTLGRLGIISEEMFTNEAICHFNWNDKNSIDTEYVYYYLNSIDISNFGKQAVKGITLNTESLNSIEINLPCLEEQQKIADFLSSIDNKIDNLTSELENLKEFKKGLLQQMFV